VAASLGLTALLDEAIEFASGVANVQMYEARGSDEDALLNLGRYWEPDFLLLKESDDQTIRLLGACVCFPSSWSLTEKIGRPIQQIHEPVPGLNPAIGLSIEKFLRKLRRGKAWLRSNWGLSRSPELNQHPARKLPRLDGTVTASEVWLRVENQALVALPRSRGILFGIRIKSYALETIMGDRALCRLIARALGTMPADVAAYKGIAAARDRLIRLLNG
jgi:hypothetical protein